jgi:type II secretory pathway pseudopilin PulG
VLLKKMKRHGFLTAELLVATALLGLIITGLAVSMNGFSLFNGYQWTRQRCTAAAQAQLDSITATGAPIDEQELKRLWPKAEVVVETTPGEPPWDGLELVQVTATARAGARQVTIRLTRYIPTDY